MTRVLFINLYYPPHHLGGYEASCADVVVRLAERGHDVAVLTTDQRPDGALDPPGERDGTVPVWRDLRAYLRGDGVLWSPSPIGRWRVERHNQRVLRRALEAQRPDVVSVWQFGALSLGLLTTIAERDIPVVYSVCDDWLSYSLRLDAWHRLMAHVPKRLRRFVRAVARVPTTVPDLGRTGPFLFVSELTRARSRRDAPWSMDDTAIVHSGVDTRAFASASAPERSWGGRLLFAGRYDPRKGIETAIRALAHLEDDVLEIRASGHPEERARLEGIVHELGLDDRVEFAMSQRSGLAQRYRNADVVVFPSEWEEPFGLVPLEAMACATPVVASGVGASLPFLVDGVNCVRFEPGNPAALAGAVRRIAADDALRRRLVDAGRSTAQFFDVDRLADAFEAWHSAAASRFSAGRPSDRPFSAADVLRVRRDG